MSFLVLVRHGQSQWNKENLFTGWKDPDLTEKGEQEAISAGLALKKLGYRFDSVFTSVLLRAKKTTELMLIQLNQTNLTVIENEALNERDYGNLSGLNKDDAKIKWGEEQVMAWRRSFDIAPPEGESLKNTAERVLPYFLKNILPCLKKNQNVLVVAHGNSLRGLVMKLDKLSPEEVVKLEIHTGIPILYQVSTQGKILKKDLLQN